MSKQPYQKLNNHGEHLPTIHAPSVHAPTTPMTAVPFAPGAPVSVINLFNRSFSASILVGTGAVATVILACSGWGLLLAPLSVGAMVAKKTVRVRLVARSEGGYNLEIIRFRFSMNGVAPELYPIENIAAVNVVPACGLKKLEVVFTDGSSVYLAQGGSNTRSTAQIHATALMEQIRWLRGELPTVPQSLVGGIAFNSAQQVVVQQ